MQRFKINCPSYIPEPEVSDFSKLIYPISHEVDDLYWFMDLQAGPVNFFWAYETNNEEMVEDNIINNVPFTNTSASLHKPGMISKYGPHLIDDEASYYVGLQADSDEEATSKASAIFETQYNDVDDKEFINAFKINAVLYARYTLYMSTGLTWDVIFNGKFDLIQPLLNYHNKFDGYDISSVPQSGLINSGKD